jgi:hypothetical protein
MGNHRSSTVAGASRLAFYLALGGSLTGCPTVDLGDTPPDIGLCNPAGGIDYFRDKVWPEYVVRTDPNKACTKAGACHNEAGGNALGFKTMPVDDAFNYRQTQIYLNCGTPSASELFTKPVSGMDLHGGGDLFPPTDPAAQVFLDWFK